MPENRSPLGSIAKYVGAKVLAACLGLGAVLAVLWFWNNPNQLQALGYVARLTLAWTALVVVLPWALFFVPPLIVKDESNALSALMLAAYLLVDALAALWLAGWHIHGALTWVILLAGLLAATIYNFIVCEFLADRAER